MRQFFYFALLGLLVVTACQKGGVKTEHGYRFVNHSNKEGTKAQPGENVKVRAYIYVGDSLMSSTVSPTGDTRELQLFPKDQLPPRVPAIYDAMLLMTEGDSATIYETIDSTISKRIPEKLKNEKEIRYELVLVDIITQQEIAQKQAEQQAQFVAAQSKMQSVVADFNAGKLADRLTKTASGLQVLIEDKGAGAPVKQGDVVRTEYIGALKDGKLFDNSYERGEPLTFPAGLGQMIKGYDEGVQLLNHGGKAFFFLPWALGYGEKGTPDGTIPPKSDLIFYVEIQ